MERFTSVLATNSFEWASQTRSFTLFRSTGSDQSPGGVRQSRSNEFIRFFSERGQLAGIFEDRLPFLVREGWYVAHALTDSELQATISCLTYATGRVNEY